MDNERQCPNCGEVENLCPACGHCPYHCERYGCRDGDDSDSDLDTVPEPTDVVEVEPLPGPAPEYGDPVGLWAEEVEEAAAREHAEVSALRAHWAKYDMDYCR